jgi:two-component system sensor histidine kinase ChvG
MRVRRRLRSLRAAVLFVVLAVVASPLIFVLVSNAAESLFGARTLDRAEVSADEIADALRLARGEASPAFAARVAEVARARDQRARVVTDDGAMLASADHLVGTSLLFRLGDVFYGPDRAAGLAEVDLAEGPVHTRTQARRALEHGRAAGCAEAGVGHLLVCQAAVRVDGATGPVVVHVMGSSRRGVTSLYESRRQLLKLTLSVLVLGVGLALWMGRRLVTPVEALRDQVLARASAAVPRADLQAYREDEVGDLAAAFNSVLAALAERRRDNEAFLADLAHEFKNPVAAIRAAAERLAEPGSLDPERAQRLAVVLGRSSAQLDALVTQFLELARAEAGLPDEPREAIDVAAMLAGLAKTVADDLRASELTLGIDLQGGAAMVHGVAHRIESAFGNLLDNAISFAGAGGHVRLELRRTGGAIEVAVIDDGPGIAAADLPRVFDRFFTTRRERRGTGLGLALTRAVVEAHGGSVLAESPAGSGARFVIVLPEVEG